MVFSNTITPFAYAVWEDGGDSSSAESDAVSSVSDAGGSSETSSTSSDAGSEASSESASDSASESSAEAASSSENTDAAETASSDEVVAEEITADESENLVEDAEVIVSDATEVSEDDESFEESDESVVEGSSDEASETEVIDLSDKKYSSKSAAQLTNLLWGDWEKDKYSFAENLGIQDYYGKPEQNEIIRQWILSHNALPSENVTHEASEAQGVSDEEDEGSDDEDDQSVVDEMEMLDLEALKEALVEDEASLSEEVVDEEASLLEKISEEVKDIINSIRYFFKKDTGSEFIRYGSDGNWNGTITLIDPENSSSIVIMDKNLWAKSTKDNGNYFQWWNNVGVEEVNAGNTTSAKAILRRQI